MISAEDYELLGFFEVEPEMMEPDDPWPYNDSVYKVKKEGLSLSFAIHPSYKDVRLIIKQNENTIYELNAVGVNDVKISENKSKEYLEIVISERESLILKLKPFITVSQQIDQFT